MSKAKATKATAAEPVELLDKAVELALAAAEAMADRAFPGWASAAIVIDPGCGLLPVLVPVRDLSVPACICSPNLTFTGPSPGVYR